MNKAIVLEDILSVYKNKKGENKIYLNKGDKVDVILHRSAGDILVEKNGNKFIVQAKRLKIL